MTKHNINIHKLVDEFIEESEFIDIKDFLNFKRIIYDELLLEEIIQILADRVLRKEEKDR
jgi:hypothetical protein